MSGDAAEPSPRARHYAENRDQQRAATLAWKAANPERTRELNRLSMRRAAARQKAVNQRRADGRAWYAANRDAERERHRRHRREHPEAVREYQRRYRERHPDRAAEQTRIASRAWRDRNAEHVREAGREAARERRAADPDIHRRYYAQNLERERARSREASRLRSRLRKLGLPPKQFHRVYAADRRANDAAADAFFARKRTAAERRALAGEGDAPFVRRTPPPVVADAARSVVDAWLEPTAVTARDEEHWRAVAPGILDAFHTRHRARVTEEVRLDSIARELRGLPALDLAAETARRLRGEAFDHLAARLVPAGHPGRIARLRQIVADVRDAPRRTLASIPSRGITAGRGTTAATATARGIGR